MFVYRPRVGCRVLSWFGVLGGLVSVKNLGNPKAGLKEQGRVSRFWRLRVFDSGHEAREPERTSTEKPDVLLWMECAQATWTNSL